MEEDGSCSGTSEMMHHAFLHLSVHCHHDGMQCESVRICSKASHATWVFHTESESVLSKHVINGRHHAQSAVTESYHVIFVLF